MKAEIITIGDEILIGQTIDTNSAWLGLELNLIGIKIERITTIPDTEVAILDALNQACESADLVIVTGGLGPTQDDITKATLCAFFDDKLERNHEVLKKITNYFETRGKSMLEVNKQQADLPSKARIIDNGKGTASGMWFNKDGVDVISMPGVPFEMKSMMSSFVIPELKRLYFLPKIYHRNILTQGIGESFLAEKIKDWELKIREEGFKLAYLPSASTVKLRLSSFKGESSAQRMEDLIEELSLLIPEHIYGFDDELLSQLIGKQLKRMKMTFGLAESCTGGYIGHLVTSIPGCSEYFNGAVVAYSNNLKTNLLNVPEGLIDSKGAVSEEVVKAMAQGAKTVLSCDWAIATSGVAGPDGGTEDKPVGTVCIAICGPDVLESYTFTFGHMRDRNIKITALTALHLLLKAIRN